MSFPDPLCKSPLECGRGHVAFAEIGIDWCGLQSGLVKKANRLKVGTPQVQRNCLERGTKMTDGCWVHRGEEEGRSSLTQSRKEEEITVHRR